ncbi:MAG TPA: CDP-alcohol phosphatidyltransferase family protein [Planctomycetota bacterium]|nr:CDP-alcohol phosphatidyltransferase family protein [Planctomycetota bacterium]HRR81242.1 CDP-alcohol phosphatidyltransferase family protein [Planctomycetota bacterium]HRT96719.1 CDP-alcohol phosphatidyltransferase family protein [Planctomycetota bacterium]
MLPLHNALSLSRYLLTPVVAALAWNEGTRPAAIALAILAGVSDFVDGPLARRAGDAKPLGALLDMTGDKVFLCTLLIVLGAMGRSPVWAAWLITSRELIVLFLRVVAAEHGKPLPIAMFGKLKTFMLYLLVPIALSDLAWEATWFLAWAATISACGSLVEYLVKMRGDLASEFLRPARQ